MAIRDHFDKYWAFNPENGCKEWQRGNSHGYGGLIYISGSGPKRIQKYPHVFAYERAKGPVPSGLEVMHSCDNRRCVNPDHLSVGTKADNIRDMHRKGRNKITAKLTVDQVLSIRSEWASGRATRSMLAARFCTSYQNVNLIVQRRNWRNI